MANIEAKDTPSHIVFSCISVVSLSLYLSPQFLDMFVISACLFVCLSRSFGHVFLVVCLAVLVFFFLCLCLTGCSLSFLLRISCFAWVWGALALSFSFVLLTCVGSCLCCFVGSVSFLCCCFRFCCYVCFHVFRSILLTLWLLIVFLKWGVLILGPHCRGVCYKEVIHWRFGGPFL